MNVLTHLIVIIQCVLISCFVGYNDVLAQTETEIDTESTRTIIDELSTELSTLTPSSLLTTESVCAEIKVDENFYDPLVAQTLKRQVLSLHTNIRSLSFLSVMETSKLFYINCFWKYIHKIWSSSQMKDLSPLVTEMRDMLFEMADSDSIMFTDLVFKITVLDATMVAKAKPLYPNYCPFATVINKTVEWKKFGYTKSYVEAIKAMARTVEYNIVPALKFSTLVELGCENVSDPVFDRVRCWDNGFAARYVEVWEYFGSLIPCKLHHIAKDLIESIDFVERAHGLFLSFGLLSTYQDIFAAADFIGLIQDIHRFSTAGNTSPCCCVPWKLQMEELHVRQIGNAYMKEEDILTKLRGDCNDK